MPSEMKDLCGHRMKALMEDEIYVYFYCKNCLKVTKVLKDEVPEGCRVQEEK